MDLLKIENLPNLFEYPYGLDQSTNDILNIIEPLPEHLSNYGNNNNQTFGGFRKKRSVLRCMHKVETKDQIIKNLIWEKNCRNTTFRKKLTNSSILCTYPVNNIMDVIEGKSKSHSQWMADLLEIYDGVIYAKLNWKGAAFNLI
jgi:hypothetical protein